MEDLDTLPYLYRELRALDGLPVVYKNPAIPGMKGSGVIVDPKGTDDEEDRWTLCFWRGETSMDSSVEGYMRTFVSSFLSGDPNFAPPYLLEVDLSKPETKRMLLWLVASRGVEVSFDMDVEQLYDLARKLAPKSEEA
jgi:hypothetical protein